MRKSPNARQRRETHIPNALSRGERAWNLFLAAILTAYGIAGLVSHTVRFSQRGRVLLFLQGGSAWLMSFALLVGACVFASWVVDHYDTRDNERSYRAFRWIATRIGWTLVASSLTVHLYTALAR